jgi:hypothetical protein
MSNLRIASVLLLVLTATASQAQEVVGTLSIIRDVRVTRSVFGDNNEYVNARNGQPIQNRYGVRTLRRSRAQVNFRGDRSILRVNELTDLVVYDEATLRRVQLSQGEVWVHVAHGVNTSIATPILTATARGTEYTVADGFVKVFEGVVAVKPASGEGKEFLVPAGHKIAFGPDGHTSGVENLAPDEMPKGRGGGSTTWFTEVPSELGTEVGVMGGDFHSLRTDPINEPVNKPTEGSLAVIIDRKHFSPAQTVAQTDPRNELGLVDDTNSSDWFPAVALAATLALDYPTLDQTKLPAVQGTVFGFDGSPAFAGIRGDANGAIGRSTYGYEANVLQYYNDPTTNVLGRFDSVLYMERPVAPDLQVFAGRMKFYEGPVFNDAIDTQLIADRYSAAGVEYAGHLFSGNLAYVYDANRYQVGTQPGLMANLEYHLLGGAIGGHVLQTSGPLGNGHGQSVTLTLPVWRNMIDGYGEYGKGIDGTTNETIGAYFPWFLRHAGVDLFFEYADKVDVAHAYSVTALYRIKKTIELRAGLDWVNGTPLASVGAAWRF